jgi:hypothetical protein
VKRVGIDSKRFKESCMLYVSVDDYERRNQKDPELIRNEVYAAAWSKSHPAVC